MSGHILISPHELDTKGEEPCLNNPNIFHQQIPRIIQIKPQYNSKPIHLLISFSKIQHHPICHNSQLPLPKLTVLQPKYVQQQQQQLCLSAVEPANCCRMDACRSLPPEDSTTYYSVPHQPCMRDSSLIEYPMFCFNTRTMSRLSRVYFRNPSTRNIPNRRKV
jgi:hypothetical protein